VPRDIVAFWREAGPKKSFGRGAEFANARATNASATRTSRQLRQVR
jgi:uncharacterized protein (DUF924 family)